MAEFNVSTDTARVNVGGSLVQEEVTEKTPLLDNSIPESDNTEAKVEQGTSANHSETQPSLTTDAEEIAKEHRMEEEVINDSRVNVNHAESVKNEVSSDPAIQEEDLEGGVGNIHSADGNPVTDEKKREEVATAEAKEQTTEGDVQTPDQKDGPASVEKCVKEENALYDVEDQATGETNVEEKEVNSLPLANESAAIDKKEVKEEKAVLEAEEERKGDNAHPEKIEDTAVFSNADVGSVKKEVIPGAEVQQEVVTEGDEDENPIPVEKKTNEVNTAAAKEYTTGEDVHSQEQNESSEPKESHVPIEKEVEEPETVDNIERQATKVTEVEEVISHPLDNENGSIGEKEAVEAKTVVEAEEERKGNTSNPEEEGESLIVINSVGKVEDTNIEEIKEDKGIQENAPVSTKEELQEGLQDELIADTGGDKETPAAAERKENIIDSKVEEARRGSSEENAGPVPKDDAREVKVKIEEKEIVVEVKQESNVTQKEEKGETVVIEQKEDVGERSVVKGEKTEELVPEITPATDNVEKPREVTEEADTSIQNTAQQSISELVEPSQETAPQKDETTGVTKEVETEELLENKVEQDAVHVLEKENRQDNINVKPESEKQEAVIEVCTERKESHSETLVIENEVDNPAVPEEKEDESKVPILKTESHNCDSDLKEELVDAEADSASPGPEDRIKHEDVIKPKADQNEALGNLKIHEKRPTASQEEKLALVKDKECSLDTLTNEVPLDTSTPQEAFGAEEILKQVQDDRIVEGNDVKPAVPKDVAPSTEETEDTTHVTKLDNIDEVDSSTEMKLDDNIFLPVGMLSQLQNINSDEAHLGKEFIEPLEEIIEQSPVSNVQYQQATDLTSMVNEALQENMENVIMDKEVFNYEQSEARVEQQSESDAPILEPRKPNIAEGPHLEPGQPVSDTALYNTIPPASFDEPQPSISDLSDEETKLKTFMDITLAMLASGDQACDSMCSDLEQRCMEYQEQGAKWEALLNEALERIDDLERECTRGKDLLTQTEKALIEETLKSKVNDAQQEASRQILAEEHNRLIEKLDAAEKIKNELLVSNQTATQNMADYAAKNEKLQTDNAALQEEIKAWKEKDDAAKKESGETQRKVQELTLRLEYEEKMRTQAEMLLEQERRRGPRSNVVEELTRQVLQRKGDYTGRFRVEKIQLESVMARENQRFQTMQSRIKSKAGGKETN